MNRLGISLLIAILSRFIPTFISLVRLLIKLLWDKRVNLFVRMVAWLCVAYLILPTRWIVPDSLPFGMIDDVIVAIIGALVLIRFSPQEVIDEAMNKKPNTKRPEDDDPDNVIDGKGKIDE